MVKRHLKRLAAPKTWDIERKVTKFITRPYPSGHKMSLSMAIQPILKEVLKVARSTRDAKYILYEKQAFINGRQTKEPKRAVGLMDVLSFPELKKQYRMLINKKGKLLMQEIDAKEAAIRPCRIEKKTMIKGKKLQLNLSDGTCLLAEKDIYKTRDTLVLNNGDNKIMQHLPYAVGATVYITKGKHVGNAGKLEESKDNVVKVKLADKTIETNVHHLMVVGKDASIIALPQ